MSDVLGIADVDKDELAKLQERIKQLEKEKEDLLKENKDLLTFKERILFEYSQTLTMFDDGIFNLENIRFRRKLSNIIE